MDRRRGALNPFSGYTAQTGHTVTYSDDNRRYYQTGLYLQDEMVWNRWHVDVSARYDRIVSQQVSDTGDLKPPFRRPYQRPRLAVVRPDNGLSPYLSYSRDHSGDAAGRGRQTVETDHRRTG